MKIGIFGDSFASEGHMPVITPGKNPQISTYIDESWMNFIRKRNYEIISYGVPGTSSFYSFKKFMNHYKEYTHIVFLWSAFERIPNMPELYKNFSSCYNVNHLENFKHILGRYTDKQIEEIKTIINAHSLTLDHFFTSWMHQKMFDDVNILCKQSNIKIINIFSFLSEKYDYNMDFSKQAGDVWCGLFKISRKEQSIFGFNSMSLGFDSRACHLSKENNKVLASLILDKFLKNDSNVDVVDLNKNKNFIYSKEITERYIKLDQFIKNFR
jgi:hypothetical protein